MMTTIRKLTILTLTTLAGLFAPLAAQAETVTVHLKSGRRFTAQVDQRTDEKHLWLRFGDSSTVLLRPIQWQRVAVADIDGKRLTAEQLQAQADDLKTPTPTTFLHPEDDAVQPPAAGEPTFAQQARAALNTAPKVASINGDAFLANWDADVETDGLVFQFRPRSNDGRTTPVGGTLEVELWTMQARTATAAPHGRGEVPALIGRWSLLIDPEHIGPEGATVRLPFQAQHPQFNRKLASFGRLRVRFVAPGHGVYHHAQELVRIRPFAP